MMRRLACLLFTLVCSGNGCSGTITPLGRGSTGFWSDRAFEIDATIEGAFEVEGREGCMPGWQRSCMDQEELSILADGALLAYAGRAAAAGKPLFLERARISKSFGQASALEGGKLRVPWAIRVESLARKEEASAERFQDEDGLRFAWPPEGTGRQRPRYELLAEDGLLRVGAIFGQMNPEDSPLDEGEWSARTFVSGLRDGGYTEQDDPLRPGQLVWRRQTDALTVEVEAIFPAYFPLKKREDEVRERLRALIQRSELVYINAHTDLAPLDALRDPSSYQPGHYRIVSLDTCWSYHQYTQGILAAAPGAHVISTDGRVITGSVGSFERLLGGLAAGAEAWRRGRDEAPGWEDLLGAMNEEAASRAQQRGAQVEEKLRPPEVYGVSRLWSAGRPLLPGRGGDPALAPR